MIFRELCLYSPQEVPSPFSIQQSKDMTKINTNKDFVFSRSEREKLLLWDDLDPKLDAWKL